MKIKKIAIVTGTRAEFGILRPVIQAILDDSDFELQLIVTGMHLSAEFGNTINEIRATGFPIAGKVECLLSSDSAVGVSKSISLAVSGFADVFENLKPDLLIVLGDRTEIFASVIAATTANILIAHIHGGESTEGAYDEGIRHSISKFSHLHFTANEAYRKRVVQLGENPKTVFDVGALGLDSIRNIKLLDKTEFEKSINFKLNKKNVLITYHPVTLDAENPTVTFNNLISAVDSFADTNIIFTFANSDKNGRIINQMIVDYVAKNPNKSIAFKSLGQLRYLSALQFVDAVVGNSSSGIIEVPMFKIPTVNIGDRQKGRILADSVVQTDNDEESIKKGIKIAFDNDFRQKIQTQKQIYGIGNTTESIMKVLKSDIKIIIKKTFFDVAFEF